MIIAIDFDGTICDGEYPEIGKAHPGALETIRDMHRAGHELILWTCREGARLYEARMWMVEHGIVQCFRECNKNSKTMLDRFGNDSRKVGADLYVDDRGIGWAGWGAVRVRVGLN